ncbi:origin recognition complex subunit 4 [Friedmanniomyces endolithicus]|uniref:Origin recognition complex subunit 4 n=1 Tax=Friedmanniomyces endolithicus TaxID=329885 RepID=A0AAN6KG47_9PEZI|nr:origin recognition complex subunit 4 [Friedmanniomyces endolithicus]KAK0290481.1 origin recognition complex subunit 4 [Friedmanniomyces endolithicus]KAK0295814.1 origin recognition complex subunit 4 [Friedmanniomyces endolithicus]KAK0325785.1 origin recognition complex subunit 4 [Friedmanniomyces endolithicus]KAK0916160.1 origin recognition complex subunit 4 [Friedmanniomyces endolithicus]
MESERSTKRRKLEAPEQRTPKNPAVPQRAQKSSPYSSKKPGFQIRATPVVEKNSTRSAQEIWAETKAMGLGLHPSLKKKNAGSTTKRKAPLDPLRNQRVSSADSPVSKIPSKAAVGFFKQFHAPKSDAAPPTPMKDGTVGVQHLRDTPASVSSEEDDTGGGAAEQGDMVDTRAGEEPRSLGEYAGEEEIAAPVSTSAQVARRKTFEDEIKELETAAQEAAKQEEEEEDTLGASSAKRRTSGRPRKAVATRDAPVVRRKLAETRRSPAKALARGSGGGDTGSPGEKSAERGSLKSGATAAQRRKANRADHIDAYSEVGQPDSNSMDLDFPEAAQTPLARVGSETQGVVPSKSKMKAQSLPVPEHDTQQVVFGAEHLAAIQSMVLAQLIGKRPIPLTNLSDEHTKVSTLIAQTVTASESNSMLLIGARGSGKTALVNQILREQAAEHPDTFHVVRLSGFVHTDDKIALRKIWRQLGREMEVEDDEGPSSRNYADTLTTLLALLSQPAEQGREQQADQVMKSVVFVLDEFELFATHPRQTLLYNLFDIAQSRKAPIAVLGLTTKIDVSESLEKRVKSRFSHRYVHLGLAKSFAAFQDGCKAVLCIAQDTLTSDDKDQLGVSGKAWNALMEHVVATEAFENHMRRLYHTTKSMPDFASSMLFPIATLPLGGTKTDSAALLEYLTTSLQLSLNPPDSKLDILPSLSTLQLALLICAARLTNIYNTDLVSFALAYEEYKVLASKAKLQSGAGVRVSGRAVAKGAWEALVGSGLVIEDGRGGNGRVDVGLEEIGACAGQMGLELGGWGRWCKEI